MTVTWTRELERRQTARQVEPGGMEELWWEGSNFAILHQHQDFEFQTSLHLVDVRDAWREAEGFAFIAENARI